MRPSLSRKNSRYFRLLVDVLPYLAGVHLLKWTDGLADSLADTLKQLAGKGALFDLLTLHHVRLDSLHDFFLALLVDLFGLLDLSKR